MSSISYNWRMSNNAVDFLKKYEQEYWQTIANGIQFLPKGYLPDFLANVKQIVIYDCIDGYLILRFPKQDGSEFVINRYRSIRWQDLLHEQKLYDLNGEETARRLTLQMKDTNKFQGHMLSLGSIEVRRGQSAYRPEWISATIVQGEPEERIHNPIQNAKRDIQTLVSANNLGVRPERSLDITNDKVIHKLESLLTKFRKNLEEARVEDDIQKFIEGNPFVLNSWGKVYPQYRLGTKYICDFLVEDLIAPDFKYIFIEIEPARTDLFHKNKKEVREFRWRVNHGRSQLRDWDIWIRENIQTIKEDFPEFDQPRFILVIGRNADLSADQKRVILSENAGSKSITILTYDDLGSRLEQLIDKLRRL